MSDFSSSVLSMFLLHFALVCFLFIHSLQHHISCLSSLSKYSSQSQLRLHSCMNLFFGKESILTSN